MRRRQRGDGASREVEAFVSGAVAVWEMWGFPGTSSTRAETTSTTRRNRTGDKRRSTGTSLTRRPSAGPVPQLSSRQQLQPQQQQRGGQPRVPAEVSSAEQELPRRRQLIAALEHDVRSELFVLKKNDEFPLGGRLRHFVDFWRKIAPRHEIV